MFKKEINRSITVCILVVAGLISLWGVRASSAAQNDSDKTLIVALDRDLYRQRELYLLEDAVSEAATSRSSRIYIGTEDGAVDVVIRDMESDSELADTIANFAMQQRMSILTTPAKSFSIDYAPSVVREFGPERIQRDASYLESYVDSLRPALHGVTITQDAHGAIVESSDPDIGKAIAKKLGTVFLVIPLEATSWHVSWDTSRWPKEWPPAKRLEAESKTAQALREILGDPIELEVHGNAEGIHFDVRDPERHFLFVQAVEEAFEKNSSFVFREAEALDMRLSAADMKLFPAPSLPDTPSLPYPQPIPSKDYTDVMNQLEELINPPNNIRIDGSAVLVEARDRRRNGELSSIMRKALEGHAELVLKALPDASLQIELAPGAHLGQGAPALTANQFVDAVKTYLNSAKIIPSEISSLGSDRVRIDFASSADAAAFKASLSRPAGLTIRLVDDASPGESTAAPSAGDEKVRLPTGKEIWTCPVPVVTGDMIADATIAQNKYTNMPVIKLRFTDEGRDRFAAATREHVGHRIAIVINGEALEVPVIEAPIEGGSVEINGNFTEESASAIVQSILPHRTDFPLMLIEANSHESG